jgi:hydrogenase maturation factor HypF (carbamoyltransferase family)
MGDHHHHFHLSGCACSDELAQLNSSHAAILAALSGVGVALKTLIAQGKVLIMDEQQVKDALTKIDTATTQIAANLQIVATTAETIDEDVTALQAALAKALASGTGVTQDLVDQANSISTKSAGTADALAVLIPVLQGIASKGVITPVPVPVPPAPPVG